MATLKDIAHACGVDVSTVSRALRDDRRVSLETRQEVAAMARTLGYRPNLAARTLQAGKTRTIWFLVAALDNPRDREPAMHAVRAAARHGYDALIAVSPDGETLRRQVGRLSQGVCDGALIIPGYPEASNPHAFAAVEAAGVPICYVDRWPPMASVPAVTSDNEQAGAQLVERLVRSGCQRLVISMPEINTVQTDRRAGIITEAARLQIPLVDLDTIPSEWLQQADQLGIVANDQYRIQRAFAQHSWQGRPSVAVFDTWDGDPYPARQAIIAVQDFAAMATAAVDRVIHALETGIALERVVQRVPVSTYQVIDSQVR